MSLELVKALLMIAKFCASSTTGCDKCALKEFCGKLPLEW